MTQKETAKQFVVCMMAAISALHLLTSCNAQKMKIKCQEPNYSLRRRVPQFL